MKKQITLITLICMIILIVNVSAFEIDNVKSFDKDIGDYGKITIKNIFGLGSTLIELELKLNTEHCELGKYCSAEKEVKLHKEGSLVDDIRFLRNSINGWIEDFSVKFKFYYRLKGELNWEEYKLGEVVKAGIYELKLEGEKPPRLTIDWQITSQGKLIDEWALWGGDGVLQYYDMNSTEELITGINNLTFLEGTPVFNSSVCLIGNCSSVVGDTSAFNLTSTNATDINNGPHTLNIWVKGDTTDVALFSLEGNILLTSIDGPGDNLIVATWGLSSPIHDIGAEWTMITIRRNATRNTLFVNGSEKDNGALDATATNVQFCIGAKCDLDASDGFSGDIDEVGFWNISLTDQEISHLYNDGLGLPFESDTINLISPEDGNITLNQDITINCSAESVTGIINISSYHNLSGSLVRNETIDLTGSSNSTEINMTLPNGITAWTCSVGSSNGIETISSENRTVNVVTAILINQTFSNDTIEGNTERFTANITRRAGLTLAQANLVYNNTINPVGFALSQDPNSTVITDFFIPNIIENINASFFWNFIFSDGSDFNTTSTNQTIFNISMDNCSIFTNQIFNFTLVDEETQVQLTGNTTIETAFNLLDTSRSQTIASFNQSFNNTNPITICLNRDLLDNTAFSLDNTVRYEAEDYAIEYFNVVNFTLNSNSTVQEIILFDLLSSDSTDFQFTFTGSDFVAVEDALVFVKRQYISENVFKTVELPKTDANGQTILHLVRNDVIYNIEVIKNVEVLGTFENIIAFCDDVAIGDCKISLSAFSSGDAVFEFDADIGLLFTNPTYNETTNIVSFNYLTTDGTSKLVTLNVTRNDILGNRTICESSLQSPGGTLTCNTGDIDDTTLIITIFVDGQEALKDYILVADEGFQSLGYFAFFIYLLAFILMIGKSKEGMLIGVVIGFITSSIFGFIQSRIIGIGAAGVWLVLIISIMIWKLNKQKQT